MFVLAPVLLAAFIASCCLELAAGATGICEDSVPPNYAALECRITAEKDKCYQYVDPGNAGVNVCNGRRPCLVLTGMKLEIRCGGEDEDSSVLQDVYRENSTQDQRNFSWPFATKSAVEGMYACRRRDDGAILSNRSVIIDESAHVIPGPDSSLYNQFCLRDIVPGFNCSTADITYYFSAIEGATAPNYIKFNVLGARPVQLNVEAVWTDHYPVDLNIAYPTEASDSTTLHVLEFATNNLVLVASQSVRLYLAITASNNYGASTMCVLVTILGEATLFPNESLPEDLTVAEDQPAAFACEAKTTSNYGLAATVAFWVTSPDSPGEPVQCLNCTFSPYDLFPCSITIDKGGCLGLSFTNSSHGQELDKTHHLTATWGHVSTAQNGSVVTCAIAVRGMTQWKNSATLTSPPKRKDNSENSEQTRNIVLISTAAVMLVLAVTVGLLSVVWCFCRKRHSSVLVADGKKWQQITTEDDVEL